MSAEKSKVSEKDATKAAKGSELSEEDRQLQEEVALLVSRVNDVNDVAFSALTKFGALLRTASGGVTSIPKPLKFARTHFAELKQALGMLTSDRNRRLLCDVLSFISMSIDQKEDVPILNYKLQGTTDDLDLWGHEYLRCLAGDVGKEWNRRNDCGESVEDLMSIAAQLIQYFMKHQDEASACDLTLETQELKLIEPHCSEHNFARVAQYLIAVSQHLPVEEERQVLWNTFNLYRRFKAYTSAARIAIKMRLPELQELFAECQDVPTQMQMALMCGWARAPIALEDETLAGLVGNRHLSEWFRFVARELDATAPKSTTDITKPHLTDQRITVDTPLQTLGTVLLNGLANCGFGKDELIESEGVSIMTKCKGVRIVAAAASVGLLHLWDNTEGISIIDWYSYSDDMNIRAGSYLATGIVMCGVSSPFDEAFHLLSEQLQNNTHTECRLACILGLGVAYAGTFRGELREVLLPLLDPSKEHGVDTAAVAAYAIALVFPGSMDAQLIEAIFYSLFERAEPFNSVIVYHIVALGAICLGAREKIEALLDGAKSLPDCVRRFAVTFITACAYAGTGNVVEVQKLLNLLAEQEEGDVADGTEAEGADAAPGTAGAGIAGAGPVVADPPNSAQETPASTMLNHKIAAVIGVALIALGEDIGTEMCRRSLIHVLMGDQLKKSRASLSARAGLPLAYALLSISNPQMSIVETLSKLSHDADPNTSKSAILALGLVSAGSNNARVATMLRSLASYYYKDRDEQLFLVRVAQGLCAMGKSHVTLSPHFSDRFSLSPVTLVSLLGSMVPLGVDPSLSMERHPFMFYAVVPAIRPRMVLAVDAALHPLKAQVRVGVPIDTVAVPGRPKAITGFQTHATPVLLGEGDRAELTGSYTTPAAVIEGVIVVDKKSDGETT